MFTVASEGSAFRSRLHEIKHDGFRIMVRRNRACVRGDDFSGRFSFIAMAVGKLRVRSGLIDRARCIARSTWLSLMVGIYAASQSNAGMRCLQNSSKGSK
jgi:hypothetical protein